MIAVIGSINMDLVVMADRAPDAGDVYKRQVISNPATF